MNIFLLGTQFGWNYIKSSDYLEKAAYWPFSDKQNDSFDFTSTPKRTRAISHKSSPQPNFAQNELLTGTSEKYEDFTPLEQTTSEER